MSINSERRIAPARLLPVFMVFLMIASIIGCGRSERSERPPAIEPSGTQAYDGVEQRDLNVILITIDTLRSDRISSYGSNLVDTPNIDRLRLRRRALFRTLRVRCRSPFPPTHRSLRGCIRRDTACARMWGYTLDAGIPTLAEVLSAGGWSTAGFISAFVLDSRWGIGSWASTTTLMISI